MYGRVWKCNLGIQEHRGERPSRETRVYLLGTDSTVIVAPFQLIYRPYPNANLSFLSLSLSSNTTEHDAARRIESNYRCDSRGSDFAILTRLGPI